MQQNRPPSPKTSHLHEFRLTRLSLIVLALTQGIIGCSLVDDEPTDPSAGMDGTELSCVELAQLTAESCVPPESLVANYSDAGGTAIRVDDPQASVEIGPNAWLVSVSGSPNWVGSSASGGVDCTFGCGYCPPGESLCHGGLDDAGVANCYTCFKDDGRDSVGIRDACANYVEVACEGSGPDETGSGEAG